MTTHIQIQRFFFLALVVLSLFLTYAVVQPYVGILFLSIILAIVFMPLHSRVLKLIKAPTLAALFSMVLLALVVLIPLSVFGVLLFEEVTDLYGSVISANSSEFFLRSMSQITEFVNKFTPGSFALSEYVDVKSYAQGVLSWSLEHFNALFAGFVKGIFATLLIFLAVFYSFRDGSKFVKAIVRLSPLNDEYDERIVERLKTAVNSVVRGHLAVGILQGLMTGLGLFIFGVPNPAIWGTVAAVGSLVPSIGTALVLLPAIIFTFIVSGWASGVGLLVWGILAVGLIDNLLGPMLIEKGIKIHPFLILISALGGISFFGPIGFIAGPVILSLFFALVEIAPLIQGGEK